MFIYSLATEIISPLSSEANRASSESKVSHLIKFCSYVVNNIKLPKILRKDPHVNILVPKGDPLAQIVFENCYGPNALKSIKIPDRYRGDPSLEDNYPQIEVNKQTQNPHVNISSYNF